MVIALALRFWRLGDWNFEATEIFTLRDSTSPQFQNTRPLLYLLNYYVVLPFMPLDEFGLRFLPAVFGVLAIPTFYFVVRRLVGTRAAFLGTLLLAFSPLHVFYSQFARYWSLVFLLSTVYPFAIFIGIRERNPRALGLGIILAVMATLAHPASVLLLGGLALWLAGTYLKPGQVTRLWSQKGVRWGALVMALIAVALAVRYVPMLQAWIFDQDAKARTTARGGEFLLHLPAGRWVKQISYLLSFVESLTLPLVLTAMLGVLILWQGRDRSLASLLAWLGFFPIAFLVLISLRTAVSTYYLVPVVPVFYFAAGVFLDRLAEVDWKLRPRWLVPATLTLIVLAAGAPTLISQYRDGRRYDFRGVARWLTGRLSPGDVIYSDQARVLGHYLSGRTVLKLLPDPATLTEAVGKLHQEGRGGVMWIVAPAPSHAFRTSAKIGSLHQWIYGNCQLLNLIGVGRVDFRQHQLQMYRCPPVSPDAFVGAQRQ